VGNKVLQIPAVTIFYQYWGYCRLVFLQFLLPLYVKRKWINIQCFGFKIGHTSKANIVSKYSTYWNACSLVHIHAMVVKWVLASILTLNNCCGFNNAKYSGCFSKSPSNFLIMITMVNNNSLRILSIFTHHNQGVAS
jgi:hypothetical protein